MNRIGGWLVTIAIIDILTVGGLALITVALADMQGWSGVMLVSGACLLGLGLYGAFTAPARKG